MPDTLIDDPVINSPFEEPKRHFRFDEDGITNEIVAGRRVSSYFMPIATTKKKGKAAEQLVLATEWTSDRIEENKFINQVRGRVAQWRQGGHVGVTRVTRRLLEHWTNPERGRPLFFCQIEAIETAIYIAEVAAKYGDGWIANALKEANDGNNPGLDRIAFKIATGGGKTAVMAMLIAWQALNKSANPQDARFGDAFLVISPGITIKDRLRVLLPTDPESAYRVLDIVPSDLREELARAKILVTNYHAFLSREKTDASKLTKQLSGQTKTGINTETPDEMVRRVCRALGAKKNIIVMNDEAHHCYRRRPGVVDEPLKGEERKEAEKRDEEARVWISGIEAIKAKIGVRAIYDLSATPFFLRGSGWPEGTLFPWVASDFSLIDAIESGVVKVPRVPVSDTSMTGEMPTYRDLWLRIRDELPKKGRDTEAATGMPKLPAPLQGAIHALYEHYEKSYKAWAKNESALARGQTPPVFIVVCQNTNHSKMVFDYIGGYDTDKVHPDGMPVLAPGALPVFSNVIDGRWSHRPSSILVDSSQLDSGEALSDDFRAAAAVEIAEFKHDLTLRFPGRSADDLGDEDILREVMNTVGKAGKLGEHVKCVVSVSMLTEGWDANTVTHILGVRAFGTQLLCEQVVGRGLRRMSYAPIEKTVRAPDGPATITTFATEYAEVFGVPFSFIPTAGATAGPVDRPEPTRVRSLEERADCEIRFPRVVGYRFDFAVEKLSARFDDTSKLALSDAEVPTKVENAPIVGESAIMTLDDLKKRRDQEVAFLLAKLVLEKYFRTDDSAAAEKSATHRFEQDVQAWLFPQVLSIARRWLTECVVCKGRTFPQMLLLLAFAHDAADRIYRAIVRGAPGDKRLMPILRPYEREGSTNHVSFDTLKPTYRSDPKKCHISHVVADTGSWEQKMAQVLEDIPEVVRYVKNQGLNFAIPYALNGEERSYLPDFIVHVSAPDGAIVNLILEVSGEAKKDKAAKAATARDLWVPAINNDGRFGAWAFLEVTDPWDGENVIRGWLNGLGNLGAKAA